MPTSKNAMAVIGLVVALTVGALIAAFVLPVGVDAITEDNSASFNQTETETVTVTGTLNATLDDVDDSTGDIDVTLNDTDTASSTTLTNISDGANKTATIEGETITVTNDATNTNADAEITYEYPPEYSFSDGAKSLWAILDIVIILAVFMMFIAVALGASNRV